MSEGTERLRTRERVAVFVVLQQFYGAQISKLTTIKHLKKTYLYLEMWDAAERERRKHANYEGMKTIKGTWMMSSIARYTVQMEWQHGQNT